LGLWPALRSGYEDGIFKDYGLRTLELHAAIRLNVHELAGPEGSGPTRSDSQFNSYFTVGAALLKAENEYYTQGVSEVWNHTSFAWLLGAGLTSTQANGFRFGIDYRQILEAKLEENSVGLPLTLDYGQLGVFIGFSF
jgi:hypothetical protein